jgi:hypothetical protein
MKAVSFYDLETGIFTGMHLVASNEKLLSLNTPAGCGVIEGHIDATKFKFDLANKMVVPYTPPAGDPDPRAAKRTAQATIAALQNSQHDVVRAALLGDKSAIDKLKAIDEQIAAYRKDL